MVLKGFTGWRAGRKVAVCFFKHILLHDILSKVIDARKTSNFPVSLQCDIHKSMS